MRGSLFARPYLHRINSLRLLPFAAPVLRRGRPSCCPSSLSSVLRCRTMSTSVSRDGHAAASSAIARDFLTFINSSPSHFHAVATAASMLTDAGFRRLRERDDWSDDLQAGGAYFYTRNQSSLVAFVLPESYRLRDAAAAADAASSSSVGSPFLILAAHTDSPVLKVKPVSKVAKHGCLQVGVECYGGGLWHTWFDRDLSVAGRVVVKKEGGGADSEAFETRLVRVDRPVLRIPNLAIHLNREVNEKGFLFNKQTHLLPVLASSIQQQLNSPASDQSAPSSSAAASASAYTPPSLLADHHSVLLELLSSSLSVPVSSIADVELSLYDTQPACLGGAYSEFVFSRALDNLLMSFISLRALIDHRKARTGSGHSSNSDHSGWQAGSEGVVNVVALFDNEEVGSESYQGAGASLLSFLQRVHGRPALFDACMRRSLLVSADMAHAVHPNYAEAHEEQHRPLLHGGLVIKQNANQRYATSTLTSHSLRLIASRHSIPVQRFVVRNDSACGSTIGPILSANTGVRTVDVGVAQWAMHSIRECCGVRDIDSAHRLFLAALDEYGEADAALHVDGE